MSKHTIESPIIKFLLGEDQLDGYWFGQDHPGGRYWWRTVLRKEMETGKTPIELAEENRELLAALKMVNEILSNRMSILPGLAIHNEIRAAIQKYSK